MLSKLEATLKMWMPCGLICPANLQDRGGCRQDLSETFSVFFFWNVCCTKEQCPTKQTTDDFKQLLKRSGKYTPPTTNKTRLKMMHPSFPAVACSPSNLVAEGDMSAKEVIIFGGKLMSCTDSFSSFFQGFGFQTASKHNGVSGENGPNGQR